MMRLICPNCSAQYEIDAGMIPDEGRDVQCSNCGHTWFELPPPAEGLNVEAQEALPEAVEEPEPSAEVHPKPVRPQPPAKAKEEVEEAPEDDWDWPETRPIEPIEPPDEPEPEPAAAAEEPETQESQDPEPEPAADEAPEPEAEEPSAVQPKRPADVAALDVLREEAARELEKRREESPAAVETQTDMALEDPKDRDTPSRALRARMARLRGEEDEEEEAPTEQDYQAPRRDLLPDIEEINSSLRPSDVATGAMSEEEMVEYRKGFRAGFVLTVGAAALMVVCYAWGPLIASVFPAAEPALISYVDWANAARDAIGGAIGGG